jgi:hypothetical protein
MTHQHTIENITYGAAGRRWTFAMGSTENPVYTYATNRMPGGRETADKVARIMNGAAKRTNGQGLDNLARSNMSKVFHDAAQARRKVVPHVGFTFESKN